MKYIQFMVMLLLVGAILLMGCQKNTEEIDTFASCLTKKGVKMYGAYWCGHCKD